jgi:transposase
MLRAPWDQLEAPEQLIARMERRAEEVLAGEAEVTDRPVTIPGVERRTAESPVAELGTDMGEFATSGQLAWWAGMGPGNNEGGGEHRSGRTTEGNRWLGRSVTQAAWAAGHTKGTYLSAQSRRLAARRGKKRAAVAVAPTMRAIVDPIIKDGPTDRELGGDDLDRLDPQRLRRRSVRRRERLGHKVSLEPGGQAA